MELEIERLAFDSLRNLGEVAEPVKQKGPCDYAESKKESNKNAGCWSGQQAQAVKGFGGQGREFSVDSKSSGEWLVM